MPRYKLLIEYDGTPFHGWQVQKNLSTVQASLAQAIYKFCGEQIIPAGAGRTDTGVHARGQVAHLDLQKEWRADKIRDALNAHLRPLPVAVLVCEQVADDFNARFSAIKRRYVYRIVNRRAPLTFEKNRVWLVHQPLDETVMHEAAQYLVGQHDFTTFRSTRCQARSPVRNINAIEVVRQGEDIIMTIEARSFLHNQVRSIMGALEYVGKGKWQVEQVKIALDSKDRKACGPVAPACGLYFDRVFYS